MGKRYLTPKGFAERTVFSRYWRARVKSAKRVSSDVKAGYRRRERHLAKEARRAGDDG